MDDYTDTDTQQFVINGYYNKSSFCPREFKPHTISLFCILFSLVFLIVKL